MGFWEWALMAHKFSKFSMASLAMTGSWSCSLQCLKMQSGGLVTLPKMADVII